jgi:NhaP-type Na+/H+ or K+/H+ antiporter
VFRPLAVLGLAVLAYAASIEAGGNGFVAAFLGGMAFGTLMPADDGLTVGFTDEAGELLSLLVWFIFGAALVPGLEHANWRDLIFAVLALTIVRLGPVALALFDAGLDQATVWFVGWFGPRGLASVIFGLIAFDTLATPDANQVLAAVTVTVALSVVVHGVTASPLAARYGARATGIHSQRPEHASARPLRTRSLGAGRRHRDGRNT